MQKTSGSSTHERTHNIYDCERVFTNCEAEGRNTDISDMLIFMSFNYEKVTQYSTIMLCN